MQVTETLTEGLRREFQVVVPAADLDAKVNERLAELKDRVRINGFRPGKVPVQHLKRVYGRSVMAEAIEAAVQEVNAKIVTDHGFKLAGEPKVTLPTANRRGARRWSPARPTSPTRSRSKSCRRSSSPTSRTSSWRSWSPRWPTRRSTRRCSASPMQNRPFARQGRGRQGRERRPASSISFTGTIDGEPFEGGSAEDVADGDRLGQPSSPASRTSSSASRPARPAPSTSPSRTTTRQRTLTGKDAEFEVTAKSVEAPGDGRRSTTSSPSRSAWNRSPSSRRPSRTALQREHAGGDAPAPQARAARRARRAPQVRAAAEHGRGGIQERLEDDRRRSAEPGPHLRGRGTRAKRRRKAEYRKIAERRVRLGLVLSEIGERNDIKVTDEEISRAVVERARQFPGQEQQVWDLLPQEPAGAGEPARAAVRGEGGRLPAGARQRDRKTVPREELYKEDEGENAA